MTIAREPGRPQTANASALRFLALCIGGWIALRVMMLWNPAIPEALDRGSGRWAPPSIVAAPPRRDRVALSPAQGFGARPTMASAAGRATGDRSAPIDENRAALDQADAGAFDRHAMRPALTTRVFPSQGPAQASAGYLPAAAGVPRGEPTVDQPFWMQRPLAGWSLGGWVYLREDSANASGNIGAGSQLGGSQAGLRLAYGFGATGRLRAYGRAVMALRQPRQREMAAGFAYAPIARLPVDIAVEQRLAVGSEGRTALAAMVTGGVSDVRMPAGFKLDAYAQGGVVGARRRDGFADGAVVVDHRLGGGEDAPLRAGALVAGAIQPGARRVDVGPRLTLRLPDVGQGSRIALDWRQRVAGNAKPESGFALTLASDF